MRILLTNDDSIYAPGLAAMERALRSLGEVYVVAPLHEQSGAGHSITFLTPLSAKKVFVDEKHWGWAVDGSPADCVKLGVSTIMPERPDLIVSGINGGLNAGINVLYSGTVAAAVEGAFYGITSIAVSLEYCENQPFDEAADIAAGVIEKILKNTHHPHLYNLNLPLAAIKDKEPKICAVPMDTTQYWETFETRKDPSGRNYYWLSGRPNPKQPKTKSNRMTDMSALTQGYITITPLNYDLTDLTLLEEIADWDFVPARKNTTNKHTGPRIRVSR
ncbi:5'-nucleotidase SurE [Planctomycetales bacterium]|nr:5'-nucleotidase SurE [Planctomycetales bacterium]